jgi:hypothetical protein
MTGDSSIANAWKSPLGSGSETTRPVSLATGAVSVGAVSSNPAMPARSSSNAVNFCGFTAGRASGRAGEGLLSTCFHSSLPPPFAAPAGPPATTRTTASAAAPSPKNQPPARRSAARSTMPAMDLPFRMF